MKHYILLLLIPLVLSGCYTKVAVKETEREYRYYSQNEYDDNTEYDTVYVDDNSEAYNGFENKIVNNYYFYSSPYYVSPFYRITIYPDFYDPILAWDYYWYVNTWWSPRAFFDGFYIGFYYRPYYYSYWYPYYGYYDYGYYYGYNYGGYSYYGTHPTKTRDNDGGRRTRDNNGRTFGSSFGNSTRENTFTGREILKDKERVNVRNEQTREISEDKGIPTDRMRGVKKQVIIDRETNEVKKIIVRDNNNNVINREKDPVIDQDREKKGIEKKDNIGTNNNGRKTIIIRREQEDRRIIERKTDRNYNSYEPPVKQNNNSGVKEENRKEYNPPIKQNRENPPVREYRNQEPPRNYSPPVNSGNNNSRNESRQNSRDSGTRERR